MSQPKDARSGTIDSLLDEIQGPIGAEHLPRAVDRLEIALGRMLEAMPEFEGGKALARQLGAEMACLRNAAREACCRANVTWTSKIEQARWQRWIRGSAKIELRARESDRELHTETPTTDGSDPVPQQKTLEILTTEEAVGTVRNVGIDLTSSFALGTETSTEPADREIDPVTRTDQVLIVRMIRRWLDADPSKSRWTLTRGQLQGLLSVIDDLSEDES